NGQYRKRWNFPSGCNTNQYIIQGIGTTDGLIEYVTGDDPWSYLVCVKDSTSTLFVSGYNSAMGCNLIVNGTTEINFENNFNISPNPSTGIFTINSSDPSTSLRVTDVEVYDVFGREVYQSKNPPIQSRTLDLSSYPKGIYFLRIKENEKMFSRKIVLQ
ncbi:MAG: T9SS type A sorting domain-containing protein, partial [Bacteroidia bacterium]